MKGRGIMAYFKRCDRCGANLDPGEVCDCNSKREMLAKKYEELVSRTRNKNNQLRFNFCFETKK